jgi:hypothetical protein
MVKNEVRSRNDSLDLDLYNSLIFNVLEGCWLFPSHATKAFNAINLSVVNCVFCFEKISNAVLDDMQK